MKNWILLFLLPLMTTAQPVFTEQQVEISQWIKGDLYIPEKSNGHLVIVIAGSGPTNRDGNQPGARSNAYKFLAEAIVANGNPVFTFDKRIVTQIIAGKANEKELLFDHQIDDVRDIIRHFRKDSNIRKIIICGHSEGSLIGMVAAQMADGYISLAGAGRTIDLVITDQLVAQAPVLKASTQASFAKLKKGETFDVDNPMLASIFRKDIQPYLISWIKYDPAIEIAKLKIPVLIINGTSDIQVTESEAKLLHQAKPDAKLVLIEKMNHVLKEVSSREENLASYNDPKLPLSPRLVEAVNQFLNEF